MTFLQIFYSFYYVVQIRRYWNVKTVQTDDGSQVITKTQRAKNRYSDINCITMILHQIKNSWTIFMSIEIVPDHIVYQRHIVIPLCAGDCYILSSDLVRRFALFYVWSYKALDKNNAHTYRYYLLLFGRIYVLKYR